MQFAASLPKSTCRAIARVAAIMATKRTSDLIPLCHPISLTKVAAGYAMAEASATRRMCLIRIADVSRLSCQS